MIVFFSCSNIYMKYNPTILTPSKQILYSKLQSLCVEIIVFVFVLDMLKIHKICNEFQSKNCFVCKNLKFIYLTKKQNKKK